MHYGVVPITKDGRLSAKEVVGNKKALTQFQIDSMQDTRKSKASSKRAILYNLQKKNMIKVVVINKNRIS
ncbi:plasmid recombination protein [Staphylococcus aureus]